MADRLEELNKWIDKLIDIKKRRRLVDDQKDILVQEQKHAESEVSSRMLEAKTSKITRGGYTISTKRELSVASLGGDTKAIVQALRKIAGGKLIGINHQQMKAWVKEKMQDPVTGEWELRPEKLPPSLRAVVKLSEIQKIGVRKGNK